jgi:hypothetical protein
MYTYTLHRFEKGSQKDRRKEREGGDQPIGAALGIASFSLSFTHTHITANAVRQHHSYRKEIAFSACVFMCV